MSPRLRSSILALATVLAVEVGAQERVYRVGLVANTIPLAEWNAPAMSDGTPHSGQAIREGLERLGWIDGKNLRIEWRSAEGRFERLPGIFDELAKMPVDVIVAIGPGAAAAANATKTVPIVMAISAGALPTVGDSLARPGRNLTGLTVEGDDLDGKRMTILRQMLPRAKRVVFLEEARGNCGATLPTITKAAETLGISIFPVVFDPNGGIDRAFQEIAALRADAVLVCDGVWVYRYGHQRQLNEVALRHRLPIIHTALGGAENGGPLSFGIDSMVQYRRVPYFVSRILRGAKPGELPIEQPQAVRLVINRKVARTLGVTVPDALVLQADRVID